MRELENTIERAVVLTRNELIAVEDLRLPQSDAPAMPFESGLPLKEIERRAVEQALDAHDGNVSATARALDVSRRWLHYKLKEWRGEENER